MPGNGLEVQKGPSRSWPALQTEAVPWGEPSTFQSAGPWEPPVAPEGKHAVSDTVEKGKGLTAVVSMTTERIACNISAHQPGNSLIDSYVRVVGREQERGGQLYCSFLVLECLWPQQLWRAVFPRFLCFPSEDDLCVPGKHWNNLLAVCP